MRGIKNQHSEIIRICAQLFDVKCFVSSLLLQSGGTTGQCYGQLASLVLVSAMLPEVYMDSILRAVNWLHFNSY